MELNKEYIISCYVSIFAFICVAFWHGMFGRYQIARCEINVLHVT